MSFNSNHIVDLLAFFVWGHWCKFVGEGAWNMALNSFRLEPHQTAVWLLGIFVVWITLAGMPLNWYMKKRKTKEKTSC